jgi:hypothetical protein
MVKATLRPLSCHLKEDACRNQDVLDTFQEIRWGELSRHVALASGKSAGRRPVRALCAVMSPLITVHRMIEPHLPVICDTIPTKTDRASDGPFN